MKFINCQIGPIAFQGLPKGSLDFELNLVQSLSGFRLLVICRIDKRTPCPTVHPNDPVRTISDGILMISWCWLVLLRIYGPCFTVPSSACTRSSISLFHWSHRHRSLHENSWKFQLKILTKFLRWQFQAQNL